MIKFSYSKQAFVDVIKETYKNKEISLNVLSKKLLDKKLINESIYELLICEEEKQCNAMAKNKDNRCSNLAKSNNKYCTIHINNPPEITWSEYRRYKLIKKM